MLRGGSWNNTPDNLRSAYRNNNNPTNRNNHVGFRIARTFCVQAGAFTDAAIMQKRVQGQGTSAASSARLDEVLIGFVVGADTIDSFVIAITGHVIAWVVPFAHQLAVEYAILH